MAMLACISVTRRATPARTLRCDSRPRCGRTEGERRPAGAGLGDVTFASASAAVAGQLKGRHAAPSAATGGSGGERTRKWRVLRGPPEQRVRPPTMLTLSLLDWGLVPRRRREEPSSTTLPLSSIGIVGRRRITRSMRKRQARSALSIREGGIVGGARRDAVMAQRGSVVAAADMTSWMPLPPTPPLVLGSTATPLGGAPEPPPREAEPRTSV